MAAAIAGGVDAVQLREKDLTARELYELAVALQETCQRREVPLLINDRIDVAIAVGAAGVHLPESSFTPEEARVLLGNEAILAASTHSASAARAALERGVDFAVLGPIFETESKRAYGAPLGVDVFHTMHDGSVERVVGIGGITPQNVAEVATTGARGIAVIGAICGAPDPYEAAAELSRRIRHS